MIWLCLENLAYRLLEFVRHRTRDDRRIIEDIQTAYADENLFVRAVHINNQLIEINPPVQVGVGDIIEVSRDGQVRVNGTRRSVLK